MLPRNSSLFGLKNSSRHRGQRNSNKYPNENAKIIVLMIAQSIKIGSIVHKSKLLGVLEARIPQCVNKASIGTPSNKTHRTTVFLSFMFCQAESLYLDTLVILSYVAGYSSCAQAAEQCYYAALLSGVRHLFKVQKRYITAFSAKCGNITILWHFTALWAYLSKNKHASS